MKIMYLIYALLISSATVSCSSAEASNIPTLQLIVLKQIIAQITLYQDKMGIASSIVLQHLSNDLKSRVAATIGELLQFASLVSAYKCEEEFPWIRERVQNGLQKPLQPLKNNIPDSGVKERAKTYRIKTQMSFNTRRAIEQGL